MSATDLIFEAEHAGLVYDSLRADWERTRWWQPFLRRKSWRESEQAWQRYRVALSEARAAFYASFQPLPSQRETQ